MTRKGYLLATAGSVAAVATGGAAQAADMPMKAPMVTAPAASWAGWYAGVSAGAVWEHSTNSTNFDPYGYQPGPTGGSTAHSGFIYGGQVGYNWQQGNFVYGLEGDISGLTGRATSATGPTGKQWSNKIDWLSTLRLRTGLAVGDTMAYVTGGLAIGGVKNSFTYTLGPDGGNKSESTTRLGWAIGGGIEHMLWDSKWTVALEGLFVDLGQSSVTLSNGKTAKFSNEAIIGRLKLNYKF